MYPGNATHVPGRFRKQVGLFINAVLTRVILQRAKNKTLTIFILSHTADPQLAQQHKAIWQAFKCQVWHGDGQYALPAVQLLQELQNGKKIIP